jgi:hypothetical protein
MFFIELLLPILAIVAARAGVTLPAVLGMVFVAATLVAVGAIFSRPRPNRVCLNVNDLDGRGRIVALDHELADASALFDGVVLDHDRETGTRRQRRWKRVVQQAPVTALSLKGDAGNLKRARPGVAD